VSSRRNLADVARVIKQHQSFLLTAHVRPDGDAIGSLLALYWALRGLGKRATMVLHDECPQAYRFLPGWAAILSPDDADDEWRFDAAVVLDCEGLERTGAVADLLANIRPIIDIDHHAGRKAFGDVHATYEDAAATAELIYELLGHLAAPLTADIATCLLAGLMFDTGSFRYANTTARALRTAAALVEAGARADRVASALFAEEPFPKVVLRGIALSRARLAAGGRICGSYLQRADFAATGALDEHAEGIVEELRGVGGVLVGILSRELPTGEAKLSFRSHGVPDVSQIAAQFGGGGHREAAGSCFAGSAEEALDAAMAAVERALAEAEERQAK